MLITALFALYSLAFLAVFNSRKIFPVDRERTTNGCLAILGLPWLFLVAGGTFWGFLDKPPDYGFLTTQENGYWAQWLVIAVMVAVPLSYAVTFRAGSQHGHREGWSQAALANFPRLIEEGNENKPSTIGGYIMPDSQWKVGAELFCNGHIYILSSVEPDGGLFRVVARRKVGERHGQ